MASSLINTLPRSTCGKCVKVLKELISELEDHQQDVNGSVDPTNRNRNSSSNSNYEPPPLTLLRAIAHSSQQHPRHDQWGQERQHVSESYQHHHPGRRQRLPTPQHQATDRPGGDASSSIGDSIARAIAAAATDPRTDEGERLSHGPHPRRRRRPVLRIEETEDGVRLTIPVETTAPARMTKWTQLKQRPPAPPLEDEAPEEVMEDWIPLATSVRRDEDDDGEIAGGGPIADDDATAAAVANPLTIELKCRRCETSGPEAGARAFLMGPEPLSIVLCHNRIDSDRSEVEEILTHELIHLYDVQTLKLDLSDCETVAYSEVRAAREAECHRSVRAAAAQRGLAATITGALDKHVYKPYCVRNIALGATKNMFPARGTACLNKVWETAYGDHRPFQRTGTAAAASGDDASSGTFRGTSGK